MHAREGFSLKAKPFLVRTFVETLVHVSPAGTGSELCPQPEQPLGALRAALLVGQIGRTGHIVGLGLRGWNLLEVR